MKYIVFGIVVGSIIYMTMSLGDTVKQHAEDVKLQAQDRHEMLQDLLQQ